MDYSSPLFMILAIIAVILVMVLLIRIILFFVKPSASRDTFRLAVPLNLLARRNRKNHVFIGTGTYSKLLAARILREWKQEKKKKDQGRILFVQLGNAFSPSAEEQLQEELGTTRVKLFQGTLAPQDSLPLAQALGLKGLQPWLANPRTSLYLFSEKPRENAHLLSVATEDTSIKAKVFYYTSAPGGFDSLVASTGSRVRMLNPHQMAFNHLKMDCPEVLPVHFVQKALNAQGEPLGYVQDGLHAMVLGFGGSGQEALRFLVEFGKFVGPDYLTAPTSIGVYDPKLPQLQGPFFQSAPALREDPSIQWHAEAADTGAFWEAFNQDALTNYIIVALDNGPRNIQLGVSLLQAAARKGQDLSRLMILVRIWNQTGKDREILNLYNAAYCPEGVQALRGFGNTLDIWTPDVISGRRLKKTALSFNQLQVSLGMDEEWEQRRKQLSQPGKDQLKNQMELCRRQATDISRALYIPTLLNLAPSSGELQETQLKYLAAQEHLHWMNALMVQGYTNGPQNELLKYHPNLVPYPELPAGVSEQTVIPLVKRILQLRKE